MPPINGPATAGVIAVSVAVAAAIAIYESPELQRITNDLRRRIAIALHAFGDSITPQERENLFNRPEDAEGFLQSRGLGPGSIPADIVADAESLRRQREELLYWNAMRESGHNEKSAQNEKRHRPRASTSSSTFDDFLKKDEDSEKGAMVFQSGRESQHNDGLLRRRRADDAQASSSMYFSVYTNPFADEHGIDNDIAFENSLMEPEQDEMTGIYSATDLGADPPSRTLSPQQPAETLRMEFPSAPEPVIEVFHHEFASQTSQPQPQATASLPEHELGPDEYMTAGQDDHSNAYSAIQAWAQGASRDASFYSPLPASEAPASEADFISDGELTPTDSSSLAGSGVDVGHDALSTRSFDVMSEDSGMDTPTSWTEVGSTAGASESSAGHA
ncbi:hypothetical protein F4777DRAFT_553248 [Nemania sp. FL0916]|nr:hypothetical protein F4777DRAFT_553248 [Nemania sp. FL0916]